MTTDSKPMSASGKWRFIDQPLSVQFLMAGAVVGFLCLASLGLLITQVTRQTDASHFLARSRFRISQLNALGRGIFEQQKAVIDVLKYGSERAGRTMKEGRKVWTESYRLLAEPNTHSNNEGIGDSAPANGDFLLRLNLRYVKWVALTDRIVRDEAIPTDEESMLFGEITSMIDEAIAFTDQVIASRESREKDAVQTTFFAISLISFGLLVIFSIILSKLYYSIAQPVSRLQEAMERYERGEFKIRVPVTNRSQVGYLESTFNDLAEKIESMVEDLRGLDELKSEFISTVSHELRTPLTSIGGYVKLIASGDAGPITDTQKEFLTIIDTNVIRLTNLINDILDVEKMESGKVQLVKAPQNLWGILKECRDTVGVMAAEKMLDLRFRVPDGIPPVLGDRSRLVQIFMNLLSNAIKYTQKGFVEIAVEKHDFAVVVRVIDSGPGITQEDQEMLFQKFYRTRAGLLSNEQGTGLGLVIARGLIEAHGGRITVEGEPGTGTTFTVSLPTAAAVQKATVELPVELPIVQDQRFSKPLVSADIIVEGGAAVRPDRSIWIIDRNKADIENMRRILKDADSLFPGTNLVVRGYPSVADAPEITRPDEAPVMVVLDPQGEPGDQTLISNLRRKIHRTVPIMVVSVSIDTAVAFAEGASALLTKPIDEREFLIAVNDLFRTQGWRILVADHNTDFRILIKRALEQRGFKVDDVDHGKLVLGRLEQEDYDLALIDTHFPDVAGAELLKVIRRRNRFKELPVFMMLDGDQAPPPQSELRAGNVDYFVGKFRGIGGIVDAITRYLEDKKTIEQPN